MALDGGTIVAKLLGAAAARVGDVVGSKLIRITKIEGALSSGVRKEPALETALKDFQTVLGSAYGELTQEVAQFFAELERSGLITAIAEAAIVDEPSTQTREAFARLHQGMMSGGQPYQLYDRMFLAFSVSFRYLAKDKALDFLTR